MTTAAPTATESVARELVELCRAGRNMDALTRLYSPDIVSIEASDFEGMPARMTGMDAIRKKNEWWFSSFEVNSSEAEGPYLHGDQFAVKYTFDTTNKKTGERTTGSEIAHYTVRDGKIVEERFFYCPKQQS
jgi:ketosteroid isomerase-like protein